MGFAGMVFGIVGGIEAGDDREERDKRDVLTWVESGADLCRMAKPATPPEHLVSYAVAVDMVKQRVLLVDHRLAGLWLPTGGHVDEGEHPAATARRELHEELGISAPHLGGVAEPLMVTRTQTVGLSSRHTDVSLWYSFEVDDQQEIDADEREFSTTRWWAFSEIAHGPGTRFDPNLPRFVAKLLGRHAA